MFSKAFVPYKGYWSSPFSRWQGTLQNEDSIDLAAAAARKFFGLRGYSPDLFDGIVFGTTIPQKRWFYGSPHFASLMGNPNISGPLMAQACATSTVSLNYAANCVENGGNETLLVATTDRMSNGPNILWPNPKGPGGQPGFESWVMDGFAWDPMAETSPTGTAETVAKKHGFTREQSDAMAIARYNKYADALKNDREFQKRYMLPLEIQISKKKTVVFEEDEGITPCTEEGMAKLKTKPGNVITFGAQTHPADGNAGMIVTTKENAAELSPDKGVTIQLICYGAARADKAVGIASVVPVAQGLQALARNGKLPRISGGRVAAELDTPDVANDQLIGRICLKQHGRAA